MKSLFILVLNLSVISSPCQEENKSVFILHTTDKIVVNIPAGMNKKKKNISPYVKWGITIVKIQAVVIALRRCGHVSWMCCNHAQLNCQVSIKYYFLWPGKWMLFHRASFLHLSRTWCLRRENISGLKPQMAGIYSSRPTQPDQPGDTGPNISALHAFSLYYVWHARKRPRQWSIRQEDAFLGCRHS